ncbi:caspase family protein [Candidatus Nitrospira allomarina]|uniref:Caspase family protein n=1 Tax=Candidatus Nitrospira allomarina TaxID=3020900 RepID=A0AA96GIT8_9BACT|nr:caspase family protein [Candidatus Nitrospira allomarina]WNM59733.1 caspase family protein [Candidatus Nitrospira allomarina]
MFTHGYAVLIGVDKNKVGKLDLPVVAEDINKLHEVFTHPDRCGYLPKNVKVLTAEEATRSNILTAMDWLHEKLEKDKNTETTAFIYYSGHGHLEADVAYLLPYDMAFPISAYALPAAAFAQKITAISPKRLLIVLDCCHAEGLGVKGDIGQVEIQPSPITPETAGFADLAKGEGRAVLSSSRSDQRSWIRNDGQMSIFTYHLVEALLGHTSRFEHSTVLVTEVMDYLAKTVPGTAKAEKNAEQVPYYKFEGTPFPIALIMGGKGLPKGRTPPNPFDDLPIKMEAKVEAEEVEGDLIGQEFENFSGGEAKVEMTFVKVKKGGKAIGQKFGNVGRKP